MLDNGFNNEFDNRYYNNTPNYNREGGQEKIVVVREPKNENKSILCDKFRNFILRHSNEVKYTIIGLIIAFLFITIGFFKTLLVIILGVVGNIYGKFRDGDLKTLYMLERIFRRF